MSRRYRGVLFDLDGTLVDSLELILASYRHTLLTHLGEVIADTAWLDTMGRPLKVQLRAFAKTEAQLEAMFDTYISHNQANHKRLIRPFAGMAHTVEQLWRANLKLCVVTSKIREHALRELQSTGLDGYFHGLIAADDVERPKPDPQPVRLALASVGLADSEALLIGDSLPDLQAAQAANVDAAAALWGPFDRARLAPGEPLFWLETPEDILAVLNGTHPQATDERARS